MPPTDLPAGLRLEHYPLGSVKSAVRNPKKHRSADIANSMERFGVIEPALLDERTGRLVAGHGRTEALQALRAAGKPPPPNVLEQDGEWLVPVLRGWASKSDTEAEALLVAVNQLPAAGGWDNGGLAEILKDLDAAGAIAGLGFDRDEVSKLLDKVAGPKAGNTDPDEVPEVFGPSRVEPGDLFILGEHRILCGDSTKPEDLDRVMAGDQADIVWTDPPWNVAYESAGRRGKANQHDDIANDNLGEAFPGFCAAFAGEMRRVSKPGAMLYLVMSVQEWGTIDTVLRGLGYHWSSTIIWAKDRAGFGRKDYHPRYEPLWYGWLGTASRLYPLEDRKQDDVWDDIPRPAVSEDHPTTKPVALIERGLTNSSARGDVVLEPFSGSGSTLLACERTGRRCRAIELMPKYVQVAVERWENYTGKVAVKEPRP